ncbi:8631_t:CDS:1 [Diversispora eburnea]|uniref:8631_t:CDS:1 n=1 Tax=Diversispora eburnea TaxID=1213867 RepID=A0A9N9FHY2_9GLOM|nr:8631_t:CDS:1 [Diversispora eburnea]
MNQKVAFVTILVAFSVFFICFTNASPIGLSPRSPGDLAFADFTTPTFDANIVTGRVTFTELFVETVRITGQFNTGFIDQTSKYEYQISGSKKELISGIIINPPGISPFQFDVENTTIQFFVGKKIKIFRNREVIGKATIQQI